jgi:putative ABC transport system permease protein
MTLLTATGRKTNPLLQTAAALFMVLAAFGCNQHVAKQIQALGNNLIFVYYQGPGRDFLTLDDMQAVQQQVPGIQAASPIIELHRRIALEGGEEHDGQVLGVSHQYAMVRNMVVPTGRFFDEDDLRTQQFARALYGNEKAVVGKNIKINGLPFVIIGTFHEQVETFGQSEISGNTILIPYTVSRYFVSTNAVQQIFFSASDPHEIERSTALIGKIIQSRHRPESLYRVENLLMSSR